MVALQPQGPADRAGLRVHDVLRGVDGWRFAPDADLTDVLLPYRPGARIRFDVLRRGTPRAVPVVLGRATP